MCQIFNFIAILIQQHARLLKVLILAQHHGAQHRGGAC